MSLPDERESQGHTVTEEITTSVAAATTETAYASQAINQGARVTSNNLRKWLVTLRSAVLDLADVAFCGILSYRLVDCICVSRVDYLEEGLFVQRVLDNSLLVVTVLGLGLFMSKKLADKFLVWEARINGTSANSFQSESQNEIIQEEGGGTAAGVIWGKLEDLCGAVLDQLDFLGKFIFVEHVVSLNSILKEIIKSNDGTITALQDHLAIVQRNLATSQEAVVTSRESLAIFQRSFENSQRTLAIVQQNVDVYRETLQITRGQLEVSRAEVARLQSLITGELGALETVRALLYERDRLESLTALQ